MLYKVNRLMSRVSLHSASFQVKMEFKNQNFPQVQNVTANRKCSLTDAMLAPLAAAETFNAVQELFGSSGVVLSRDEDSIHAELSTQQGHRPFVLCVAVCGLAFLAPPVCPEEPRRD